MEILSRSFLFILVTLCLLYGGHSTQFTFINKCKFTIWPATQNGGGFPQLSTTGFELTSNASSTLHVSSIWSGRFWARTQCTSHNNFTCVTSDCSSGRVECNGFGGTPPASLIEITLSPTNGGLDFYDVSIVDGFNLPLSITPTGAGSGGCHSATCSNDVNLVCPLELAVKGSDGSVVACKSACLAFQKPEYCCTGEFGAPDKCGSTDYSEMFKRQCPQAYSYAYDDKSSLLTCAAGADYVITFCP